MSRFFWLTDDDKEVREGDVVFSIEYPGELLGSRIIREEYGHPPVQNYHSKNKYFYTQASREKHLLEHKRGLSVDQVIKALGLKKNDKRINNLKEIIKSELKC